ASPRDAVNFDIRAIEEDIVKATRRWEDDLKIALVETLGEESAVVAMRAYAQAFPVAYRNDVSPRGAVRDLGSIETLSASRPYAHRRARRRRRDRAARVREIPQAGRVHLQPGLHRADARRASGHHREAGRALPRALRPAARGAPRRPAERARERDPRRAQRR